MSYMYMFFLTETSQLWAQPDTAPVSVPADIRFSVWISFFEIYNELLYDLLEPPSHQHKRQTLRLCEDQNGNPYVKGMQRWRWLAGNLEGCVEIRKRPSVPTLLSWLQTSTGFMFVMLRKPGNF